MAWLPAILNIIGELIALWLKDHNNPNVNITEELRNRAYLAHEDVTMEHARIASYAVREACATGRDEHGVKEFVEAALLREFPEGNQVHDPV